MVSVRIRTVVPLFFAFLLLLAGCKDEVKEAWQMGYDANYKTAHQAGVKAGEARGTEEGAKKGAAKAREAAETGCAWQLYSTLACRALISGIVVGLFVQYAILLTCRLAECLPQQTMIAFIPAMKTSPCARGCREMLELAEQLDEATEKLDFAGIQAVRDSAKRILDVTKKSIDQLRVTHIVERTRDEASRIVNKPEEVLSRTKTGQWPPEQRLLACPHCRARVRYKEQGAGKTVKCPNQKCGKPFKLPP